MRKLVARVNVILRRAASRKAVLAVEEQQPLRHGNLTLDSGRRAVTFADAPVALTALEFSIISRLIEKPGHVLNRARIMAEAYGGRIHVADRTVDSHIRNIRAKFASAGCSDVIETVNRVGFRLGSCGG
jgi:two-component system OmpR family response regulator